MVYSPRVLSAKHSLDMNEITELLERNDIDSERSGSHVEYNGDRFDYTFWYKSIVQRDYGEEASRDDFKVWKIVSSRVEENLKFPYAADLEPPFNPED